MARIDVAMRASLRRGLTEMLVDTLLPRQTANDDAAGLAKVKDAATGISTVAGDVSNAKTTFSSWDNCMAQNYCKWPAIIGIIVGTLIILSILTCIVRCMCLGYSCCCACFSCLKCCQCCGSCCEGKKGKSRHPDHNGHTPLNQAYTSPMPMMTPVGGGPPQYAQFEVGKKVSEDALPHMPSWDSASKHVEVDEKRDVELGDLDPVTGQKVPLMAAAGTAPSSPAVEQVGSPFGQRPKQGVNGAGYVGGPQPNLNGRGYRGTQGPQYSHSGMGIPRHGSQSQQMQGQIFNYAPPPQQRQYSGSNSRPQFGDRTYTDSATPSYHTAPPTTHDQNRMPSPQQNSNINSSFDFGIPGQDEPYYRHQQSHQHAPPRQQPAEYSGYRPYQPVRQESRTTEGMPGALMPGGDGGGVRTWSPVQR